MYLALVMLFTGVAGDEPPVRKYDFLPNLERRYFLVVAGQAWLGTLDESGDFQNTMKWCPLEKVGLLIWEGYGPLVRSPNGNPEVYEYRSGHLIPGRIENGVFVPDLGGKIISFADYTHDPQGRCIYNLPGYFRPKQVKGVERGQ